MRALPLFVLVLNGCAALSGKPEGDWLLTIDQKSEVCNGEEATDLQEPMQSYGVTWQLRDGTYVFAVEGLLLKGEATREGFTLRSVRGTDYSDPDCTSYAENSTTTFTGSFGEDLAMGGSLELKISESATDCYGQNVESSCTYRYNIAGILLQSTRQDHLNGGGGFGVDTGYF